jgi:Protein of unknown function (DUF2971)
MEPKPDPLTPEEHASALDIAYRKSLKRGNGTDPPPYNHELATGDFWQAAGEVIARRMGQESRAQVTQEAPSMLNPNIRHLYMYRPPNDFTKKIFEDMKLWASKPGAFNDPFDCDLEVAKRITEEDVMYTILAMHGPREKWPPQIASYANSIFDADGRFTSVERERLDKEIELLIADNKNSGVICLCEVNDSILMWSHYASHHSGICIEFERTPGGTLGDSGLCTPVHYDSKYPETDLGKMLLNRDGHTLDLMMRYKAECWNYEKEWRVFTDKGNMQCALVGKISKVIFGLRITDSYRAEIQALCDARNIRTVQAAKANRQFKIVVPQ